MQQPSVKVCGITRSEDAQFALKCGASKLGFILYEKSPRSVGLDEIQKIKKEVNFPVDKMVAVEVEPDFEYLRRLQTFGFGHYQIHFSFDFPREEIVEWSKLVGPEKLWLAPKLPFGNDFPDDILSLANTFIVDTYSDNVFGGTGELSNWKGFTNWQKMHSTKNWILAGGLSPQNISKALEETCAKTIDTNSGVESSPGIKCHKKLKDFFAKIY